MSLRIFIWKNFRAKPDRCSCIMHYVLLILRAETGAERYLAFTLDTLAENGYGAFNKIKGMACCTIYSIYPGMKMVFSARHAKC